MVAALAVVGTASAQAPAKQAQIRLRCEGVVTETATEVVTGNRVVLDGSVLSVGGTVTGKRSSPAVVRVEVGGGTARIQLPNAFLVGLRSKDGWWELLDVVLNDTDIIARAKIGLLHRPSIRISRIGGDAEISGAVADFTGKCVPEDVTQRLF